MTSDAKEHLNGGSFACSDEAIEARGKDLECEALTKSMKSTEKITTMN